MILYLLNSRLWFLRLQILKKKTKKNPLEERDWGVLVFLINFISMCVCIYIYLLFVKYNFYRLYNEKKKRYLIYFVFIFILINQLIFID